MSTSRKIDLIGFSYLFTLFCIFALYNALNFIDGSNGSAISVSIFWVFFLFLKSSNIIYLIYIVSLIIILIYNLKGKIFLGNSGTSLISIFISLALINNYNLGLILADEIIFLLFFPGIDMIRVTFLRLYNNQKIYMPDKTHFHHFLINKKFKYIWLIILFLTISPIIIFYLFKNIVASILILSVIYLLLLILIIKSKYKTMIFKNIINQKIFNISLAIFFH